MKEKITKQNNLFAKFMNYNFPDFNIRTFNNKSKEFEILSSRTDLLYHSSWDWLMPCIGKISSQCEEPEELDGLKYALLTDNIDEAYLFVTDYLKNYYEK